MSTLHSKYDMRVSGVLHVGAHHAEESNDYQSLGYRPVYWIEADRAVIPELHKRLDGTEDNHVINAVVSNEVSQVVFNVANNEQSSSILKFGTHSRAHPEVVFVDSYKVDTTTIDILHDSNQIKSCNFMNLDIQGAELMALQGATNYLSEVDYIYSEVNKKQLYKGCCLLPELDSFLDEQGFVRVEISMTVHGWGDAFYVRKNDDL